MYPLNGMGGGGHRWWSIEELGEGASVVRSKAGEEGGVDREVWVLRVGGDDQGGSEFISCDSDTSTDRMTDNQINNPY